MSTIKENHRAILAGAAPEPRWKAKPGSDHRCCFDAQVVDTTKETIKGYPDVICEAHDMENAEKIAAALNAAEPI